MRCCGARQWRKSHRLLSAPHPFRVGGLEREITILGTTSSFRDIREWTMALGEFLPNVGMERAAPLCAIGANIRSELFKSETVRLIGQWLRVGDRRCRVAGVMSDQGTSVMIDVDEIVIIPVVSAQALFDTAGTVSHHRSSHEPG